MIHASHNGRFLLFLLLLFHCEPISQPGSLFQQKEPEYGNVIQRHMGAVLFYLFIRKHKVHVHKIRSSEKGGSRNWAITTINEGVITGDGQLTINLAACCSFIHQMNGPAAQWLVSSLYIPLSEHVSGLGIWHTKRREHQHQQPQSQLQQNSSQRYPRLRNVRFCDFLFSDKWWKWTRPGERGSLARRDNTRHATTFCMWTVSCSPLSYQVVVLFTSSADTASPSALDLGRLELCETKNK